MPFKPLNTLNTYRTLPNIPPEVVLPPLPPGLFPIERMIQPPPPPEKSIHPGAMVGGALGEAISIPFAPLAGPLAPAVPPLAAGAGGAIGEFVSQATGDEPFNLREIKRQAILQGGGNAIGRLAVGTIKKGVALISGGASPEAKRAISFLSKKGLEQPLLPAEATDNRVLDLLDNVSQNSLIGGGAISKFKQSRKLFMDGLADDILTAFGRDADPDTMGKLFIDIVDDNLKMSRVAANNMYNLTDDLLKPVHRRIFPKDILGAPLDALNPNQLKTQTIMRAPVNIGRLKAFATNISRTQKQASGISAEAMGDDIIAEISSLPNTVDFSVAKNLKTRLMKKVDFFDVTDKTAPAKGIAKKGISMLDDAIESQLKTNHPDLYDMWREANELWKSTGQQFNNRFIRTIIRKVDPDLGGDPEMIVNSVFKSGRVERIRKVKNALDISSNNQGRALWNKLRSWAIHDSFKKGTNKEGELIGIALEEGLFGRNGLGDKVMRETFSPDEIGNLKEFINALKVMQALTQEGTGRIFIQLSQAGAIVSVATGKYKKAAFTILGGPYIISKIFTNPRWSKALIDGLKLGNKPQAFITAMTRLSAEISGKQILPSDLNIPDFSKPTIQNLPESRIQRLPNPIGVE